MHASVLTCINPKPQLQLQRLQPRPWGRSSLQLFPLTQPRVNLQLPSGKLCVPNPRARTTTTRTLLRYCYGRQWLENLAQRPG